MAAGLKVPAWYGAVLFLLYSHVLLQPHAHGWRTLRCRQGLCLVIAHQVHPKYHSLYLFAINSLGIGRLGWKVDRPTVVVNGKQFGDEE